MGWVSRRSTRGHPRTGNMEAGRRTEWAVWTGFLARGRDGGWWRREIAGVKLNEGGVWEKRRIEWAQGRYQKL